jgi:formylglycine-generating enzyme required for sulfatase activity
MRRRDLVVLFFSIVFSGISYGQEGASVVSPVPADMVYIGGGYFMMGSPVEEPRRIRNEVLHQVKVSSFYLGKYEVSIAEYAEVTGVDIYAQRYRLRRPGDERKDLTNPDKPVRHVSWYEAVEYCNMRSEREGLRPAYRIEKREGGEWLVEWDRGAEGYRLPTEAEWEYGCRAGTAGPFNTGEDISPEQASYRDNVKYNTDRNERGKGYYTLPLEVGRYAPNQWGLYAMHGNVWEWCWDWYEEYPLGEQTDPGGPMTGVYRILRGGAYNSTPQTLRSAFRNYIRPSGWDEKTGFRVARSVIPD